MASPLLTKAMGFAGMLALVILAGAALADDTPAADLPVENPESVLNVLRVCADPNNMPFSSRSGDGFENRLAGLVAASLGLKVEYTWWAQHRGYVRNTLKAGDCDVLIGVPALLDSVETTRPYYRSTYVFVSRASRGLDIASIRDERLRSLKIGVQLVGDNGSNTPPAHAIAALGLTANVTGYSLYGDYDAATPPPARIIAAVANGDIDIAAVWGPLAGWFAKEHATQHAAKHPDIGLTVTPIENTEDFAPLMFRFDIAMGVRKGDHALRDRLDAVIAREQPAITELLRSYGVPLVQTEARPEAEMPAPAQ
jgi:quinoprotein dehydrogenase-associated probable ABC transporter substrate-binding protein